MHLLLSLVLGFQCVPVDIGWGGAEGERLHPQMGRSGRGVSPSFRFGSQPWGVELTSPWLFLPCGAQVAGSEVQGGPWASWFGSVTVSQQVPDARPVLGVGVVKRPDAAT